MTTSTSTRPSAAEAHAGADDSENAGAAEVPGGVVHELPDDMRAALLASDAALAAWRDITPLARNEFICWVTDAKQAATRRRRIEVADDKLRRGERRLCCWPGCKHRERTGHA